MGWRSSAILRGEGTNSCGCERCAGPSLVERGDGGPEAKVTVGMSGSKTSYAWGKEAKSFRLTTVMLKWKMESVQTGPHCCLEDLKFVLCAKESQYRLFTKTVSSKGDAVTNLENRREIKQWHSGTRSTTKTEKCGEDGPHEGDCPMAREGRRNQRPWAEGHATKVTSNYVSQEAG